MSVMLLVENQGNGVFKKHEIHFDGKVFFRQCIDYNSDGKYELIAVKDTTDCEYNNMHDQSIHGNIISFVIEGTQIDDNPIKLFSNALVHTNPTLATDLLIADYELQGIPSIVYYRKKANSNYEYEKVMVNLPESQQNTAPNQPSAPNVIYDAGDNLLKINWDPSSDKESTAADLSYALRIGTEEGIGNMFFVHARKNGTRRNLMDGNCGFATSRTIDVSSWPAGDYYIAIQAIDASHRGSAFSKSVIFHKPEPSADFIMSYHYNGFGTNDTCRIALRTPKEKDCTYKWDLADGKILSTVDEGADIQISFPTGGKKDISLTVTTPEGKVSKVTKTIDVIPVSIVKVEGEEAINNGVFFMDLDGDGTTEIFYKKFYQGDKDGHYEAVKKLWNASYPEGFGGRSYIVDFNKDGLPDVYVPDDRCIIKNEGDMQMNLITDEKYGHETATWLLDLDNDGDLDDVGCGVTQYGFYHYADFKENVDGSYATWNEPVKIANVINTIPVDYNKDGLIDFYTNGQTLINNGNLTFNALVTESQVDGNSQIVDLDGDGKWDKVYHFTSSGFGISFYGEKIIIEWGDGSIQEILCPDGSPFSDKPLFYDVDNNGCLDICIDLSTPKYWEAIYYMKPDHSYTSTIYDKVSISFIKTEYTCTDGRKMLGRHALSGKPNSKPEAPTALRSSQNSNAVVIEWNHSIDKETPAALMRYNISIKRKETKGENAYLISPFNMGNDEIELPSPIHLLEANKFTIPLKSIPAGEYEVKVQGIDRWYTQSKFSETYTLKVLERSVIEMPTTATVDVPITVKFGDNNTEIPDFGKDAMVEKTAEGIYSVKWTSVGMKVVSTGTIALQNIYVQDKEDGKFIIPEQVLKNAKVTVNGSDLSQGHWDVSLNGGDFIDVKKSENVMFCEGGTNTRRSIIFTQAGNYTLRHHISNEQASCHFSANLNVAEGTPTISNINIDDASMRYRIIWNNTENMPDNVEKTYIYKEMSQANQYQLLDSVSNLQTYYTDKTSAPEAKASRYKISYKLSYGESATSEAHRPIRLTINSTPDNTFHLSWNKYEGINVDSYRILGGTTAHNLQEIATVSNNTQSYTTTTTDTNKYYTVEAILPSSNSYSNIVHVDNAIKIVEAKEIVIFNPTGSNIIGRNNVNKLQLVAHIYPISTSLQQVNWNVTEGKEYAAIDSNGMLSVNGTGPITVTAQTIDGSNITGEIQLVATNDKKHLGDVNIDNIVNVADVVTIGNYILLKKTDIFSFNSGDINNDKKISMSDLVATVNIALEYNMQSPTSLASQTRATSTDKPSIGDAIEVGDLLSLPVNLNCTHSFCAFQMDLNIPDGMDFVSAELMSSTNENHVIVYRELDDKKIRIISYSPENTIITNETGRLLKINLTKQEATSSKEVEFDNVVLVSPSGEQYACDNVTSIINVKNDVNAHDVKVYSNGKKLHVESNINKEIPLYNIQGNMVEIFPVKPGMNVFHIEQSGIYIFNNTKLVVK